MSSVIFDMFHIRVCVIYLVGLVKQFDKFHTSFC